MTKTDANKEHNLLKGYSMMLYFAGTMLMWDPENECIIDFWSEGVIKTLPVSSSNPNFIMAASQLRQSAIDENRDCSKMKDDYNRLFKLSMIPMAPPLETKFSSVTGINGNMKKETVTEFYNSYGWKSQFTGTIPDDHVGVELLFLTLMIDKYLELDDEVCNIEMKKEIRRFIKNHLMNWVPAWNRIVQENALTSGYRGISSLVIACIEDIYSLMDTESINHTVKIA